MRTILTTAVLFLSLFVLNAQANESIILVSRFVEVPLPPGANQVEDLIIEGAEDIKDEWLNYDQTLLSQIPITWFRIDPTDCKVSPDKKLLLIPRTVLPRRTNSAVRVRISR